MSLLCGSGGELAQRTLVLTGLCWPVEAVSFAWLADKTPCVDAFTCETLLSIFLLGGDVDATDVDRALLVAADAALNELPAGGLRIKSPSIVQAHQPDGERPVFLSDEHYSLIIAVWNDLMIGSEGVEEASASGRVRNGVAGHYDLVTARTQHSHHLLQFIGPHRINERRNRFVGGIIALLCNSVGRSSEGRRYHCKGCEPQRARNGGRSESRGEPDHGINRICVRLEHDTDD